MPKSSIASWMPKVVKAGQAGRRRTLVDGQQRLGDLERQPERARGDSGTVDDRLDPFTEVGFGQLAGREVHAQGELLVRVRARSFQALDLAARLGQHPFADRHDEPGLLGQVQERGRQQQPAGGWFQRRSASTPVTCPFTVSTMGW